MQEYESSGYEFNDAQKKASTYFQAMHKCKHREFQNALVRGKPGVTYQSKQGFKTKDKHMTRRDAHGFRVKFDNNNRPRHFDINGNMIMHYEAVADATLEVDGILLSIL